MIERVLTIALIVLAIVVCLVWLHGHLLVQAH